MMISYDVAFTLLLLLQSWYHLSLCVKLGQNIKFLIT